jgi:hypothetical protein
MTVPVTIREYRSTRTWRGLPLVHVAPEGGTSPVAITSDGLAVWSPWVASPWGSSLSVASPSAW